jgi:hypothetical protein
LGCGPTLLGADVGKASLPKALHEIVFEG